MMKKTLIILVSLLIPFSLLAGSDCSTCKKMDELSKAHSSIKKQNEGAIEDSVDAAILYAENFKFSGNVKQRQQEIKSLVALLVSVNKDDVMGRAAELLDYYLRHHPNSAVRKGFDKEIELLEEDSRKKVRKDIEHAAKVKAKGNG